MTGYPEKWQRSAFRLGPPRDYSQMVGNPAVIQVGTERISTGKSASRHQSGCCRANSERQPAYDG